MFCLSRNHEYGINDAILVVTVNNYTNYVVGVSHLVRLHGKLNIEALEDLMLHVVSEV